MGELAALPARMCLTEPAPQRDGLGAWSFWLLPLLSCDCRLHPSGEEGRDADFLSRVLSESVSWLSSCISILSRASASSMSLDRALHFSVCSYLAFRQSPTNMFGSGRNGVVTYPAHDGRFPSPIPS